MTPDLSARMRSLSTRRRADGHVNVTVTLDHFDGVLDLWEAAEAFSATSIELTEAMACAAFSDDPRLVAARFAHSLAATRFFALRIPPLDQPEESPSA